MMQTFDQMREEFDALEQIDDPATLDRREELAAAITKERRPCEVPLYDLSVPAWPHLRPCGAPATGTGVTGKGRVIGTCDEHAEDA